MSHEGATIELSIDETETNLKASITLGDLAMPEGARQAYRVARGTDQLVIERYAYPFNTEAIPVD